MTVAEKTNVGHSVDILVDGEVNRFIFNLKDEKADFISKENKFCKNELLSYGAAFDKLDRKMLKLELDKKRLAHAKHLGFNQIANTGVWNNVVKHDDIVA